MPTKGTTAKGIRVDDKKIEEIMERCQKKGWSFGKWINWAIDERLRSHEKGGE